jgi:hypothetical protein
MIVGANKILESDAVNSKAATRTNLKHWRRDLLLGYLS